MTCGECKRLHDTKTGTRCYPRIPVWADVVEEFSRARKPSDPASRCPCFERKEEK